VKNSRAIPEHPEVRTDGGSEQGKVSQYHVLGLMLRELRYLRSSADWDETTEEAFNDAIDGVLVARARIRIHHIEGDEDERDAVGGETDD